MAARWQRVAIIGVGAIGASIGHALRKRGLTEHVVGITRSQQSAEAALALDAVDSMADSIEQAAAGAELVIVCTSVSDIADHVRRSASAAPAGVVLTDAGSTKARLCEELKELDHGVFVGSHPLAGTHEAGPRAMKENLLAGRRVVMTPTSVTPSAATSEIQGFWEALGATVRIMDAEDHDRRLAYASHVPHLIAFALSASTPDEARELVASGWKDATRIAQSSPALWEQIVRDNRDHTLKALDDFAKTLASLRDSLKQDQMDQLMGLLEIGKQNRDAVGN